MRLERRGNLKRLKGTEEEWRDSGTRKGKDGFPNLGDSPTEQGMDLLKTQIERGSPGEYSSGGTQGDELWDLKEAATPSTAPIGLDQDQDLVGVGGTPPLETEIALNAAKLLVNPLDVSGDCWRRGHAMYGGDKEGDGDRNNL